MIDCVFHIRYYIAANGKKPFIEWLSNIDQGIKRRVRKRLDRIATGNLGDYKSVGEGVFELRLYFGSGYMIYFSREKDNIILLLAAGDKSSQSKDILQAKVYLEDYKSR